MNWSLAAVQMDCTLGAVEQNLEKVIEKLRAAAKRGANFVAFPECILTGYGFADRAAAVKAAQTVPGPASEALEKECRALGVYAGVGSLERAGDRLFNNFMVCGPRGFVTNYRKIHLPCMGADRFTDPGDKPFEVHDLDGVRVGIGICFDNSFPESVRVLTLLGADIVLQPTNWVWKALKNASLVARVRALENHIYYCAINRVGTESGQSFCGHSSIINPAGDFLAFAEHDREDTILATFDPVTARNKHTVHIPGEYELDRVGWRRPEMYGKLTEPNPKPRSCPI